MNIRIKKISSREELEAAWLIRKKVFIEEQKVDPDLEYEHEEESVHFLALADGNAAGASRWRKTEKGIKLERFAVLKEYRKQHVGRSLLQAMLKDIPPGPELVYLHAQTAAEAFYLHNGFVRKGAAFEEAGLSHYLMVWQK
jgi:predicted GNAT family N-acyltransferase